MNSPNHAQLAALALDLLEDLKRAGYGECPTCDGQSFDCETCGGSEADDREVNGGDLVETMGVYFQDLSKAAGA